MSDNMEPVLRSKANQAETGLEPMIPAGIPAVVWRVIAIKIGRWTAWTGQFYRPALRKKDGRLVWRTAGRFGPLRYGRRPSEKLMRQLAAEAGDAQYRRVIHNEPVYGLRWP
jgi:hypothetical protein